MPEKRRGRAPFKERQKTNLLVIGFVMLYIFAVLLLAYILDVLGA